MSADHVNLQRQPFLTPLWLSGVAVVLLAAFIAWLGFATWLWTTAHSTTVIVIRHAEKLTDAGDDPSLSAAGQARAELLARMFGAFATGAGQDRGALRGGRLDAIYVTPPKRNRETAAPLAQALGVTPVIDGESDAAELAYRVLHEHPGGRVLIVGHSDTVPAIVQELSGESNLPPIADREYGTMYVITVPRIGTANYLRLNY